MTVSDCYMPVSGCRHRQGIAVTRSRSVDARSGTKRRDLKRTCYKYKAARSKPKQKENAAYMLSRIMECTGE